MKVCGFDIGDLEGLFLWKSLNIDGVGLEGKLKDYWVCNGS